MTTRAYLIAGIPDSNMTLFHRVRFSAGDPAALLLIMDDRQILSSVFIVRDIEADRARAEANAAVIYARKTLSHRRICRSIVRLELLKPCCLPEATWL